MFRRALLRLEGEDVFGCKIALQFLRPTTQNPQFARQDILPFYPIDRMEQSYTRHALPFPPPPNPALVAPPRLLDFQPRCVASLGTENWSSADGVSLSCKGLVIQLLLLIYCTLSRISLNCCMFWTTELER